MGGITPDDLPKDNALLKGVHVQAPTPDAAPPPTHSQADPRFLDPLILEYIDGRTWKVVNEFIYRTDVDSLQSVKVPAGFVTDFASVPRILWRVLPPTGMYGKAAVVHDYLYRTPGFASKADADRVFLEAMTALGVGWWTCTIMYQGVRCFGGGSYKGNL